MAQVAPQLESRVLELYNDFERSVYIRCDHSRARIKLARVGVRI